MGPPNHRLSLSSLPEKAPEKTVSRRREAESKLKSTDQNLLRVKDVLGEIKRQISSIERQARKAALKRRGGQAA